MRGRDWRVWRVWLLCKSGVVGCWRKRKDWGKWPEKSRIKGLEPEYKHLLASSEDEDRDCVYGAEKSKWLDSFQEFYHIIHLKFWQRLIKGVMTHRFDKNRRRQDQSIMEGFSVVLWVIREWSIWSDFLCPVKNVIKTKSRECNTLMCVDQTRSPFTRQTRPEFRKMRDKVSRCDEVIWLCVCRFNQWTKNGCRPS